MLKKWFNKSEIVRAITKDKSVVFSEINLNSHKRIGLYDHKLANRKYAKHQNEKQKIIYFTNFIQEEKELLLRYNYSPEEF